jgi:hypothetical protein
VGEKAIGSYSAWESLRNFAMFAAAALIFLNIHRLNPLLVVIVGIAPPYVASLYAARRLSEWLKPDLVKRADENAARRIAGEQAAEWLG